MGESRLPVHFYRGGKMDLKWSDIRRDWASPPNWVSYIRLLLVIPISLLVLQLGAAGWVGFVLLLVAALSDKLDGWLAKRNDGQWITTWGKFIDPIIDKLLVIIVMIVVCTQLVGEVQVWVLGVAAVTLIREIVVMYVKSRQPIESAAEAGRFSMVAQSAGLLWLCLPLAWGHGDLVLIAPLLIGLGASLASGWAYLAPYLATRRRIRRT